MKRISILPVILALLFISSSAKASHLYGGELTYQYNGSGYTIQVVLYRNCVQAAMPNNISLDVYSVSKNASHSKNMTLHHLEDIAPQCATANTCVNPSSTIPGYQAYYYIDTVMLADTASDWVFSTTINSRTTLDNLGSGDLYLDAWLDNTDGENDIAFTPPPPPMFLNTASTIVPLQTLDHEGDSIAIDTVAPRYSTLAAGLYFGGYSPNTPLGANGVYSISNTVPQTMTIHGSNVGKFALAYRVKEYRNGVMVGAHLRDFVVTIASGNAISYPQLTNAMPFIYTCPGSTTDTAKFSVQHPANDSIYIAIDTPVLSGFSFVSGGNNGKPSSTAYCTWSAPSNLNWNNLKHYYVVANVHDNNCPPAVTRYAMLVKTRQCNVDSVWPGDANNDKVVNLLDPLTIALNYGETGIVRPNASNNWVAQYGIDWGTNTPNSIYDKKYADCDGNGTINNSDLTPVGTHWGQTHPKDGPSNKTTAAGDLYFDLNGLIFQPGMAVTVPINLGNTANPITDFYGLGVRVDVQVAGAAPLTQATITYPVSWLGTAANTVRFAKYIANGTIDWAYARNDHKNVSGGGIIAMLKFDIPATAKHGDTIFFTYRLPTFISADGKSISGYNTIDDTAYIQGVSVAELQSSIVNTQIIPNPSYGDAMLSLSVQTQQDIQVSVTDITGKQLWRKQLHLGNGAHQVILPADGLNTGIYIVQIADENGIRKSLKWVKH